VYVSSSPTGEFPSFIPLCNLSPKNSPFPPLQLQSDPQGWHTPNSPIKTLHSQRPDYLTTLRPSLFSETWLAQPPISNPPTASTSIFEVKVRVSGYFWGDGYDAGTDRAEMRTTVTGLSYVLGTRGTGVIMVEDCVTSNRGDWGRKCQTERQALSDCSEEKYSPRSIPGGLLFLFVYAWFLPCSFRCAGIEGCGLRDRVM